MPRQLTAEEIKEQKRIAQEAIDDLANALGGTLMDFDDLMGKSKLDYAKKSRDDAE